MAEARTVPLPGFSLLHEGLPQAATGVPVLCGETIEQLFPQARHLGREGPFFLYQSGNYKLGCASFPVAAGCTAAALSLYAALLKTAGPGLCRVWNYVPGINDASIDGREQYQEFCLGRAQAFENFHGLDFAARLPAASAVGTDGEELVVMFAAHPGAARHFENPLQTPAYQYPSAYGPRPPSFARATLLNTGADLCDAFISGTASIRGHLTIAPGNTAAQLLCTLENMEALGEHCGLGAALAKDRAESRHIKVYLRHAQDLNAVRAILEKRLLIASDHVSYLRADICRSDLNVEIELSALEIPTGP